MYFKKISFLNFVILAPCILLSGAENPECCKPTVVIDFHGVMTKFNLRGAANAIRAAFRDAPTIRQKIDLFFTLLKPSTFRSGAYVQSESLRRIYNDCHDLNPEMVQLVQELKKSGYPVILFTNMDSKSLDEWRENNQHVFENFSAIHSVTVDTDNTYHAELRKKYPQAYISCAALINQEFAGKPVVLIDDKPKVLEMAQKFMLPQLNCGCCAVAAASCLTTVRFTGSGKIRAALAQAGIQPADSQKTT